MVYAGGVTCSLKLASIKRIPCKQPDNDTLVGPSFMWLISQVCLRRITQEEEGEASLETDSVSRLSRKSHSCSSSQAVIHIKCVAGDNLFKHVLTRSTDAQEERQRECDHARVRLRGLRWVKDANRVISFHTEPSITSHLHMSLLLKCGGCTASWGL